MHPHEIEEQEGLRPGQNEPTKDVPRRITGEPPGWEGTRAIHDRFVDHWNDAARERGGTPDAYMSTSYTVSGDSEHVYVSDGGGRIVATCADVAVAETIALVLNGNLSQLLKRAGWERVGGVGTHATWIEP